MNRLGNGFESMMGKQVRLVWAAVAVLLAGIAGAALAAGAAPAAAPSDKAAIEKITAFFYIFTQSTKYFLTPFSRSTTKPCTSVSKPGKLWL